MPSLDVEEIGREDGIRIRTSSRGTLKLTKANFPTGNISAVESKVNQIVQGWFEDKIPLSQIAADDPVKQGVLLSNERIEGNQLVTTTMYVKVHIFSLNPLDWEIICSVEPVPDNWWVGLR